MRVRMLKDLRVTVDGVHTLDLVAGDYQEVGDGVGADLIDKGYAEDASGAPRNDDSAGSDVPEQAVEASWPSTHAAIDELAEKFGVTFPDPPEGKDKLTIAEKVDVLEAAGHTPGEAAEAPE